MPDTLKKIEATFDSYWNSNEFDIFTDAQRDRLAKALNAEKKQGIDTPEFLFDINPYSYQQEILDKIDAERKIHNHYKNLIVAATGTGKTVISAFDYKRFCTNNPKQPNRLLFVAHREEILKQSIACFRGVLKDNNFGDLFVGNHKPDSFDYLFISIQTLNSQEFITKMSSDYYDYIIVDEFHHAAAKSYQELLTYFKLKILLGLTATPERMDNKNIIEYFDNRVAAEIRLPEAIDRKLLSPFQYFGVSDTVDLNELKWGYGGYDKAELSKLYSLNKVAENRANFIIDSINKYVTDLNDVKGLGFCVTVEHAKFMAEYFNNKNIPSICLHGESEDKLRSKAKSMLVKGDIKFIFVVDIYNEGVDIPEVNTVLFLRPTESLTVFLQQLGRGLRLAENKECLTVLDFIGQANKKYNFEDKFAALLSNSKHSIQREIKDGFNSVPKGCFIQLERKAKENILNNIRSSFGAKAGIVSRLASFKEESKLPLTINNFVDYYHLDIRSIYERGSFSRLSVLAGEKDNFSEEIEDVLTKAFPRLCAINSPKWISFLLKFLPEIDECNFNKLSKVEQNMIQMLYVAIWNEPATNFEDKKVKDNLSLISKSTVMKNELIELLQYNYDKIDLVITDINLGYDCSLELYGNYSMRQVATAMDYFNYGALQGLGVKYFDNKKTDVFFITLNKSDKDYSHSTMYNDYSINENKFHWQSQSTTSETSKTGERYINHLRSNNKVLLFVREYKKDDYGVMPYTFLGSAQYVSHEGSRPMSIIWELNAPIPAKFLKKTNKLIMR